MKSIIYSFSPGTIFKEGMINTYSILKNIAKHCIVSSKCNCKVRVCLGPFKFITHQNLAIQPYTILHLIISGKNIDSFESCFEDEIKEYEFLNLLGTVNTTGNAFNYSNDKTVRSLCWKHHTFQSKNNKYFRLTESTASNYAR